MNGQELSNFKNDTHTHTKNTLSVIIAVINYSNNYVPSINEPNEKCSCSLLLLWLLPKTIEHNFCLWASIYSKVKICALTNLKLIETILVTAKFKHRKLIKKDYILHYFLFWHRIFFLAFSKFGVISYNSYKSQLHLALYRNATKEPFLDPQRTLH